MKNYHDQGLGVSPGLPGAGPIAPPLRFGPSDQGAYVPDATPPDLSQYHDGPRFDKAWQRDEYHAEDVADKERAHRTPEQYRHMVWQREKRMKDFRKWVEIWKLTGIE